MMCGGEEVVRVERHWDRGWRMELWRGGREVRR